MSREQSDDTLPSDLRIRRIYEAVATERTPLSLDAAVLTAARQALRTRTTRRWLQPLAVAASTVLCVGLVFQLLSEPEPLDSIVDPADPGISAVHQAAIESRVKKMGGLQREKAGATAAPFDDAIPHASPVPDGRAEPPACSPEDRLDPVHWLSCIQALESEGERKRANVERASLLREYPAFDAGTE